MIEAGAPAPDFHLRDHGGQEVGLGDFAGRRLVLAFYPGDFSPACTDQFSVYQEVLGDIESRDAALVGVSVDSTWCHRAFRKQLNLTMPLLSDFHPKGEMSDAYGAFLPDYGTTNRSLVVVDAEGVVRWSHAEPTPATIPGANLIFDALDAAD